MARAMTSDELAAVRSAGQWSKLYLAIHNPAVVFACRVNQVFTTSDRVVEFDFDGVTTGAYTDVLEDMTVWVGSSLGAYDLGQGRVRKVPTSSKMYIGEISDVAWADNLYITVVDEFGLWPRHLAMDVSNHVYMDYDIPYVNQHTAMAPIPAMGPPAVAWLTGADVTIDFDASDTPCLSAGSISYVWDAPGASATSGMSTATPAITYDAVGVYRVTCSATVGGVTGVGHRYVFVYSMDSMPAEVKLRSCGGDYEGGGWDFECQIFSPDADITNLRDRAMVVLFAKDFYSNGTDKNSIGPIAGRENVIAWGWVDGETLDLNPIQGRASMSVKGPNHWMNLEMGFPLGLENTTGTANAWTNFHELTTNKAVYHWTKWRSTVAKVIDVYFIPDEDRQAPVLEAPAGTLWQQLLAIVEPIMARPCCDRYGRLFVEINSQYIPEADRVAPDVMTVTTKDWTRGIPVRRAPNSKTSKVDLSGIAFTSGAAPQAYFSLSPGHVFKRLGRTMVVDRRLLSTQAKSNTLAGLIMGNENKTYDFEFDVAGNNRMVDICPAQYVATVIDAADTPLGITYNGRVVVRSVEFTHDESRFFHPRWVGEQETFAEIAVNGDILKSDGADKFDLSSPPLPAFPALPTIPLAYLPPSENNPNHPKTVVIASDQGVFFTKNFDADAADVVWESMNAGLTTAERTQIAKIVVTRSGAIYIMTNGDIWAGWSVVKVASGVGSSWRTIFSSSEYPNADSAIVGLGINPNKSDEIAIWGGRGWSWPYDGNVGTYQMAIGNQSGVNLISSYVNYSHLDYSTPIYSENGWSILCTQGTSILGSFSSSFMDRFSASGVVSAFLDLSSLGAGSGKLSHYGCPIGTGKKVVYWDIGHLLYIDSVANTATYDSTMTSTGAQGIAFSPTGLKAMGQDNGGNPYKTTDGGSTWSSASGVIPVGSDVWENCGDDNRWIFGGGTVIRLTIDQGASYVEKGGNLSEIAPLIDITGIRFIN